MTIIKIYLVFQEMFWEKEFKKNLRQTQNIFKSGLWMVIVLLKLLMTLCL